MSSTRHIPLLVLTGALSCTGLLGQTPAAQSAAKVSDDTVTLSVFDVSTSKDVGYQSANAAEATRMNTPIENIPMNVTIFNEQFIADLLATDTSELLVYEASTAKTTENDGFLARGSASIGANFLNGFAQTGGNGSQPLSNVDRVEVIRGPAAILYGSGGYGGTINRITKQPQARVFNTARIIVRDKSSSRIEFDHNSGYVPYTNRRLMFRLNGVYEHGYTWFGQRKHEDSIAPSLTINFGPLSKIVFEYLYNWRDTQGSWETPVHAGDPKGMVTGDGVYHVMPRQVDWNLESDYRHNTRHVASYNFQHAFTRKLQFRSQFQFERKDQDNAEVQACSAGLTILKDTALMPRSFRLQPRYTDNYRTRNELIWEVSTGPFNHRILFGHGWVEIYDLNISYLAARGYGGITNQSRLYGNGRLSNANAGNTFNYFPNLTYADFIKDPAGTAGFNMNNYMPINMFYPEQEPALPYMRSVPENYLDAYTKTYTRMQDMYVNDVFSFYKDRAYVMAGFRYSENKRHTEAFASGSYPNKVLKTSATMNTQTAYATTHSIGAVYHLNKAKTYTLYGNLNTSFSPEYRSQPDGSRLDPETGKQKEIGLRFSLLDGRLTALVTYFDLLQDKVTRASTDPDLVGYYEQVSGQRSTGFEVSLNANITKNWLVFSGFSNTDARNELTGLAKDLQPQYRFNMFNRYNFNSGILKGFNVSLGTIYTGERPLTPTTERNEPDWGPMPEWWRIDTIIGYKWRPKSSRFTYDFSFKVTNLFDNTEIYYVGQNARYTLDPGREWQAVVGVRF